jgi:UDP-N-acetylglucosamine 4,6-dehydratase
MPTNLYGATKCLAEHLAVSANSHTMPRFSTAVSVVRYGNVLASRGSVVHLWRKAVEGGEMIPVTDRRMTRFWLTLDEAVGLILWALRTMRGGETFVPCLPAMAVTDLATAVAPGHGGWPVVEVGLRAGGEKLHERLLGDEEARRAILVDGRIVVPPEHHSWTARTWDGEPLAPALGGRPYDSEASPFGRIGPREIRAWLSKA